jgi:hypothetical protein
MQFIGIVFTFIPFKKLFWKIKKLFKKINPLLCLITLMSLLTFSCASAPQPEWVTDMEAVYPRDKYLVEKGMGKSAAEAKVAGTRAIARYISMQIDSRLREESISTNDASTKTNSSEITEVNSQMELFALRYTKPWFNKDERQWESIAYISRDEAWEMYEPRVRRETNSFLDLYKAAGAEPDAVKQFAMYRGAQNYYRQNCTAVRSFADRIHPEMAARKFTDADTALKEIPRKTEAARARAVIFIDCPNDYENRITQAFEIGLNGEGFRVTKKRGEASGVFNVTVNENETERKEGGSVHHSFNPSLQAALNGASGVLFSYNPRAIKQTVTLTHDVGKRRAYIALAEEVEKTFPGEFRKRLASFAEAK